MPYYAYKPENQAKYAPVGNEPFIKNVPREKLFILPEGQTRIRILPPYSPEGIYARRTQIHWGVGMSQAIFVCPNVFREGSCPFCEVYYALRNEYQKYEPDVNSTRPAKRWYSNIVNVSHPEMGVLVYSYGKKVFTQIDGLQTSGDWGNIFDPVNGRDITLSRVGSKKNVQDVVYPTPTPSSLQNPAWLDQMYDLDRIFVEPNMDDVRAAFNTHSWKIYNPGVKQPSAAMKVIEEVVGSKSYQLGSSSGVGTSSKPETPLSPPVQPEPKPQPSNAMADLAELEKRLREKLHQNSRQENS